VGKVFSILGLIVSSASAFWLLAHEIREKTRTGDRLLKKRDLLLRRRSLKADIEEIRKNLAKAFKEVDPTGEKMRQRFGENTKDRRLELRDVELQLEKLDEEEAEGFADAWPSRAHIGGFGLLLLGFVMQLIAEIKKAL